MSRGATTTPPGNAQLDPTKHTPAGRWNPVPGIGRASTTLAKTIVLPRSLNSYRLISDHRFRLSSAAYPHGRPFASAGTLCAYARIAYHHRRGCPILAKQGRGTDRLWCVSDYLVIPPRSYDMARNRLVRLPCVLLALGAGCIELQLALQGVVPGFDGRPPTTDRDGEPDDRPEGNIPVVRLDVSNPSPQVNEEVVLTCSLVGDDAAGVRFDFQPADGRLFVNRTRGTASFIVEETDIGVAFALTCTATNETGTSGPSNQQVIIATP